jgi:hypothetical protein
MDWILSIILESEECFASFLGYRRGKMIRGELLKKYIADGNWQKFICVSKVILNQEHQCEKVELIKRITGTLDILKSMTEPREKMETTIEVSGGIKLSFQVEIPQIIIRDLGESFSNVGENNMEDFMEAVIKITEDCSESVTKKWKTTVYTIRKYLEKG